MSSIRANIARIYEALGCPCKAAMCRVAKSLLFLVLLAALFEVFLFNINYFATFGYESVSLNNRLSLPQIKDGQFQITAVDNVIEFSDLNIEVNNIFLEFDSNQSAQDLTIKIQFTDEAHQTYFDSTEYTAGVPCASVSTFSRQSQYLTIHAAGKVDNLRIEVVDNKASYPIKLKNVSLNEPQPFNFNVTRFTLLASIFYLVFAFRPKSAIYRINIKKNAYLSRAAIAAASAVEIILVCSLLFMGTNLVGIASKTYNNGSWDGVSAVNVVDVGGENAQQYALLAEAFVDGQVYLEEEPPQWLQDMENPYDKDARDQLQKETGETYLFDVAYYEGHYYVYFGVLPALLFYLPFYLATGLSFPTAIGVLLSTIAFILGCSALLYRVVRCYFSKVNLGLYLLLQIPLVFCCGVLYLLKFPTFYSLPIALGLAFSVWGLYFWVRGKTSCTSEIWYITGSLCMALVAGCRPQLLVLSLVAFPLFWRRYISDRRLLTAQGMREFICLLAPYVFVAVGIMWYNSVRFGSPFDFGANYNLTVNDMTKRGWDFGRLAPAFFAYFIQPPCVSGVFPYLQPAPFETTYLGQTVKEVTFGGLFACLPFLWVLSFSKEIFKRCAQRNFARMGKGIVAVLVAGGILVALLDAQMAGILQRYFADFGFMFLAAAVLLVLVANESLNLHSNTRRILLRVLLAFVAISVLYSMLLCFVPETGWYSDVYDWAYRDMLEMVMFWT